MPGPDDCCPAADPAIEFDASMHGASSGKVQLCLDQLVPAASAACPAALSPDPWAGFSPGRARLDGYHSESDEELWECVEVEPWPLHGGVMEKGEMEKMHEEFVKEMEEKEKMHDYFLGDACSDISEGSLVLFQGVCCRFPGTFWAQSHPKKSRCCFGWLANLACMCYGRIKLCKNGISVSQGWRKWGCSGWVLCHTGRNRG